MWIKDVCVFPTLVFSIANQSAGRRNVTSRRGQGPIRSQLVIHIWYRDTWTRSFVNAWIHSYDNSLHARGLNCTYILININTYVHMWKCICYFHPQIQRTVQSNCQEKLCLTPMYPQNGEFLFFINYFLKKKKIIEYFESRKIYLNLQWIYEFIK